MIHQRVRMRHVPPTKVKIDDSNSTRSSDAPHAATSPAHLKHETKSHMAKIKMKTCVYKVRITKELTKILNKVLSP